MHRPVECFVSFFGSFERGFIALRDTHFFFYALGNGDNLIRGDAFLRGELWPAPLSSPLSA